MSLSRAFTTRRAKVSTSPDSSPEMPSPMPKRSLTTKHAYPAGTIRHKISAPIELISTTNMLSYNAPDIYPSSGSSVSSNSSHSGDESDRSPTGTTTPMTSPDTSSIESSSPITPEPNHLSCYFGVRGSDSEDAPQIPKRAPSHTKKLSESIARHRSTRMPSPKNSKPTARSSINMFTASPETIEPHPFGNELAQVSEVAENFSISQEQLVIVDPEEQELIERGLFKFSCDDYMSEIQGLFISAFHDIKTPMLPSSVWI